MIQFNLLPDVKQQYVKARRTKRLVTLASIGASALAVFIMILMLLTVDVVQKKHLSDLNGDIKSNTQTLTGTKDLNKILTVQNQLNTLTDLHNKKAVASRLFPYMSQVTPTAASISKLTVDFSQNTATVAGEAPSLDVINTYVDTLKATTYSAGDQSGVKAFSAVVLSSFGRDSKSATYTITFGFDPLIFDNANNVTLKVPAGPVGAQTELFQKQAGS